MDVLGLHKIFFMIEFVYRKFGMNIQKSRKYKKKTLLVVLIVAIITIAAGLLVYFLVVRDSMLSGQPSEQSKDRSDKEIEYDSSGNSPSAEMITKDYEDNTGQAHSLSGFITSANVSGDFLLLRVQIDELLSDGVCSLTLSKGQLKVKKDSGIIDSATSSSCYGFDVPVSELSPGTWQIEIVVSSNGKHGTIKDEVRI